MYKLLRTLRLVCKLSWIISCSEQPEPAVISPIQEFGQLRHVSELPEGLRQAARAVLKVSLANDTSGTGVFIADSGLLLTNNHVVGVESCAKAGCFITIQESYEVGSSLSSEVVFARPVLVAPDLDVSILQLTKGPDSHEARRSPNFVEMSSVAPQTLVGETVYEIGHPHGTLKKFSSGKILRTFGSWFESDHFGLPGNSGSPIVNSAGQLIGIHHRGSRGHGNIRQNGINHITTSTSARSILERFDLQRRVSYDQANLEALSLLSSVALSNDDVVKSRDLFITARAGMIEHSLRNNEPASEDASAVGKDAAPRRIWIADILGEHCEQGLKTGRFQSVERFHEHIEVCEAAIKWIDCRGEGGSSERYCPSGDGKDLWNKRFHLIASSLKRFNADSYLYWLIVAPGMLEKSRDDELAVGKAALQNHLEKDGPQLDLVVAYYLAHFMRDVPELSYQGIKLAEYLRGYRDIKGYENFIGFLLPAWEWFANDGEEVRQILFQMLADPKVSLQDRLYLEARAYDYGWI